MSAASFTRTGCRLSGLEARGAGRRSPDKRGRGALRCSCGLPGCRPQFMLCTLVDPSSCCVVRWLIIWRLPLTCPRGARNVASNPARLLQICNLPLSRLLTNRIQPCAPVRRSRCAGSRGSCTEPSGSLPTWAAQNPSLCHLQCRQRAAGPCTPSAPGNSPNSRCHAVPVPVTARLVWPFRMVGLDQHLLLRARPAMLN